MAEFWILIVAILAFLLQVFVLLCCVVAGKRLDEEMGQHFSNKFIESKAEIIEERSLRHDVAKSETGN